MLLDITSTGYDIYRESIHQNCITGQIHGIFMPFAVFSVGLMANYLLGKKLTYNILLTILIIQTIGFGYIYPLLAGFNYTIYICILEYLYHMRDDPSDIKEKKYFYIGLLCFLISWFMMEIVGHAFIENNHSDLTKVINSIYWTPLYGWRSLLFIEQCI